MVKIFPLTSMQSQHVKITLGQAWFSLPGSSMVAERCFLINLLSAGEIPYFAIRVLCSVGQAQRSRGFYYMLYNKRAKEDIKQGLCCPLL